MTNATQPPPRQWWRHGVCYQIWPTSFATSSNTSGDVGSCPTGTQGTIRGVIDKLDYIKSLGATYIWVSPCYASPLKDQGYDISNYEDIHPSFGTVADIEELIKQLHDRDMKLLLDLVINHTSDQHNWFKESSQSRDGPLSNYYHWKEPRYTRSKSSNALIRRPPNQWACFFGGSAWKWCPERQQYYLHMFLESMPDLNWEDQVTRDAIFETSMEFWLKKGVDGFRLDACGLYSKRFPPPKEFDEAFSEEQKQSAIPVEEASEEDQEPLVFDMYAYSKGPKIHDYFKELRVKTTAQFGEEIMFVAENPPPSLAEGLKYLDPKFREEDIFFDFSLFSAPGSWSARTTDESENWDQSTMSSVKIVKMDSPDSLDSGRTTFPVSDLHYAEGERMPTPPLPLAYLRQSMMEKQSYITDHNTWCTIWLENHDMPRSISRFGHQGGDASLKVMSAKLLAILSTTLSGSLFLYQGQEIGMSNIPWTGPQKWNLQDLRDAWFVQKTKESIEKYEGRDDEEAQRVRAKAWGAFNVSGRDHSRTPMQWSDGKNAGFCPDNETTWMRINKSEGDGVSVAEQEGKNGSLLELWRQALKVRKEYEDVLCYGKTRFVDNANESVFSYIKESWDGKKKMLVVMNFSDGASELPVVGGEVGVDRDVYAGEIVLGNGDTSRRGKLDAWEGRVYQIV